MATQLRGTCSRNYLIVLRTCAEIGHLGTGSDEPRQHDPGHRQIDEGLTARMRALKIAREPTVARNPGIGPFHYPSPLEHMKAWGHNLVPVHLHAFFHPDPAQAGPRMLDDLQMHPEVVRDPLLEGLTSIAAVAPDHLETR